MELPDVRNPDSPRDLLKDLGQVYTENVKLGRDVVYGHLLREGVRLYLMVIVQCIGFLGIWINRSGDIVHGDKLDLRYLK